MNLDQEQIDRYHRDGFLVIESLFDPTETRLLGDAFESDCETEGPHRILEGDGSRVRALYASHERRPEFGALVRSPRLLGPSRQLLTDDMYVYQFKINSKSAFGGDKWAWHQDFVAWRIADNLPEPSLVNVGFFIDEVTEFNGPLIFIPGSHRDGLVREARNRTARSTQHLDPDDIALSPDQMETLVGRYGMVSPKGPAGSVIFFHPEIVHGSAPNMSPFARRLLIVTYNDVTNQPRPLGAPRPSYVVGRDTGALQIVDEPLDQRVAGAAA